MLERFYEAVFEGCLPVVVLQQESHANNENTTASKKSEPEFPFADMLPGLRSATVIVHSKDIEDIDEILKSLSEVDVVKKQLLL